MLKTGTDDLRRGFTLAAGALLAVGAAYFLYLARSVLVLLFLSIIVAQALQPLVDSLRKRGCSFAAAAGMTYSVILAGCALLAWRIEVTLYGDLTGGLAALAGLQHQLQAAAVGSTPILRGLFDGLTNFLGRVIQTSTVSTPRQDFAELRTVATLAYSALALVVFSWYWLAERQQVKTVSLRLLPARHRSRVAGIWDEVEEQFGAWARGELLLMAFIAVPFGLLLAVLGVQYRVVLALFAGIVGVIPVVGSIIGPAPAVLVALSQGFGTGMLVLVIGVFIQLVEGIVIGPRVMRRLTGVSPLVVLCAIIIGATVAGIGGALIAVPLAAVGQVVLRHLGLDASPQSEIYEITGEA